jgi:hypothetical protein
MQKSKKAMLGLRKPGRYPLGQAIKQTAIQVQELRCSF